MYKRLLPLLLITSLLFACVHSKEKPVSKAGKTAVHQTAKAPVTKTIAPKQQPTQKRGFFLFSKTKKQKVHSETTKSQRMVSSKPTQKRRFSLFSKNKYPVARTKTVNHRTTATASNSKTMQAAATRTQKRGLFLFSKKQHTRVGTKTKKRDLFHLFTRKKVNPPPMGGVVTQRHAMSPFTGVQTTGLMNVKYHTGASHSLVTARADRRDLPHLKMLLKDGTLNIKWEKGYPKCGPVSLEIYTKTLRCISYEGKGVVVGKNLDSRGLSINVNNKGHTEFDGKMNLKKLNVSGDTNIDIKGIDAPEINIVATDKSRIRLVGSAGLTRLHMHGQSWFSLYWLETPRVFVDIRGKSYAQMAGVVDKLTVEAWDHARFNGRYLRARQTFVRTHNKAEAQITTIKAQHTQALDTSNIYFYHIPKMNADHMGGDGAVLDMRDWNIPDMKDYGPYNQNRLW